MSNSKNTLSKISILKLIKKKPTQELIVALVTVLFIVIFSIFVNGFATKGNFVTLIQNVTILGVLSAGMAIVVIGRGIDLSEVAIMAVSSAWVFRLLQNGVSMPWALLFGLIFVVIAGILNGFIVAYIEIPALFTTLATGIFIFGVGTKFLLGCELLHYLPETHKYFGTLGQSTILGIPFSIIIFILIAFIGHQYLFRTSSGRFIYAHGDTESTARLTGIAIRPLTILEYTLCAVIAYLAGLVRASMVGQIDMRIYSSTLIFDVILVVVLGGVSLIGGRGSMWSVLVGTALIGTLLNGMTLMNVQNDVQSIIKGLALLAAIILDNRLHPRDEETARQGDI